MSKLLIAGVFMVLSATASAGETGVINQAGPYEATMRFYLHPAHGFPGKAETTEQGIAAADAKEKTGVPPSAEAEGRPQASAQTSKTRRSQLRQVAARDPK
jgi:hypothetical protein